MVLEVAQDLAGRHLDVMVAERIMGWQWYTYTPAILSFGPDPRPRYTSLFPGKNCAFLGAMPGKDARAEVRVDGLYAGRVPSYSDDDGLALQVADAVQLFEREYDLCKRMNSGTGLAEYRVVSRTAMGTEIIATGDTRAEALCRAALVIREESDSWE